jgi:hypothetical protein
MSPSSESLAAVRRAQELATTVTQRRIATRGLGAHASVAGRTNISTPAIHADTQRRHVRNQVRQSRRQAMGWRGLGATVRRFDWQYR